MELMEITSLFTDAMYLATLLVTIMVLPGLLIGLVVAIFQAATTINEQTLSFLPKLILTLLMVLYAGQWMLQKILDLFALIFFSIPNVIG